MYQTISNIDKPIILENYIDNTDNKKKVGLLSFTYTLGWYNIKNANVEVIKGKEFTIPPGYYNLKHLADYLEDIGITVNVNENNRISSLIRGMM